MYKIVGRLDRFPKATWWCSWPCLHTVCISSRTSSLLFSVKVHCTANATDAVPRWNFSRLFSMWMCPSSLVYAFHDVSCVRHYHNRMDWRRLQWLVENTSCLLLLLSGVLGALARAHKHTLDAAFLALRLWFLYKNTMVMEQKQLAKMISMLFSGSFSCARSYLRRTPIYSSHAFLIQSPTAGGHLSFCAMPFSCLNCWHKWLKQKHLWINPIKLEKCTAAIRVRPQPSAASERKILLRFIFCFGPKTKSTQSTFSSKERNK